MSITSQNNFTFKDLITQFNQIRTDTFSGNLIVRVENVPSWMLCFTAGRLAGISGGIDAIERWQRNLALVAIEVPVGRSATDCDRQAVLSNANKLTQEYAVKEVLFDIIQFSQNRGDRLFYQLIPVNNNNSHIKSVLPLVELQTILTETIQAWQEWHKCGLASYAPSLVPAIHQSARVADFDDNLGLQSIISSIDGRKTLRSLAIDRQKKLIDVAVSLLPLLKSGLIKLSPVRSIVTDGDLSDPDLNAAENRSQQAIISPLAAPDPQLSTTSGDRTTAPKVGSLIACIDDSPSVYQHLEKIITAHGHRSFGIQDPLKIIPSLIKNKPDLIFLDLVMPVTNGYEVCEQIRKTPSLAKVPIIILTGSDGLVDRVRTKFVGANGFLSKPIQAESIVLTIDKYLKKKPAIKKVSAQVKAKQTLIHVPSRQRPSPIPEQTVKRVLIVDDDRNIREIVSMCLHKLKGWDIVTAASGREGLTKISIDSPDAIVLDLMMPEMDGLAFLRHLRAQNPAKIIPVILLTASRHVPEQQRLQELGVVEVIAKPFLPIDLVRQIDRVLNV
jgi:two-component system, chemotaxis family, response regulator PixG